MRQAAHPRPARPARSAGTGGHRIIERPRLIKLLDEATARTILLIAPAGYGKTTLARQWLDQRPGSLLTVGLAPGDVTVLARSLARALSEAVPTLPRVVEEAISAAPNPAGQLRSLIQAILAELEQPLTSWLVIDDYQALDPGSPPDTLISTLEASGLLRLIVSSRACPVWATWRRRFYGEVLVLTQRDLALGHDESAELLAGRSHSTELNRLTEGWPALVGLAASADPNEPLPIRSTSKALYDFFAEEVFAQANESAQEALFRVTLFPRLRRDVLEGLLGESAVAEVLESGLALEASESVEIHPLVRNFLDAKIMARTDLSTTIRRGIEFALEHGYWDEAFDLIARFGERSSLAELITRSYLPLVDSGRVTTLESFGLYSAKEGGAPQVLLDLIDAETALRDGFLKRAVQLGEQAGAHFPSNHPLKARALIIAGSASHLDWQLEAALEFFTEAKQSATRARDQSDAAWGRCLSAIFLEDERLRDAVDEYSSLGGASGADRLRVMIARQHLARLSDGLYDLRRDEALAEPLLTAISDPLVRTGWGNTHGYSLVLQARYAHAKKVLTRVMADLDRYALEFGRPHVEWSLAAAELGLRQFARADALLRRVEQQVGESGSPFLHLNALTLRARLLLTQRRYKESVSLTHDDFDDFPRNAMYGEYLATRALALACSGQRSSALEAAATAESTTRAVEVRVLAAAAVAVAEQGGTGEAAAGARLVNLASRLQAWDGMVVAIRAFPQLLSALSGSPSNKVRLAQVLARSNDQALARAAGLGTQRRYQKPGVLSRREGEVVELLAQGLKTRDIAAALFIAETTVKVHIRHILEKLNARTRAEAVARYTEASARAGAGADIDPPGSSKR